MNLPTKCDYLVPKTPEALKDPQLVDAWNEFVARYPTKEKCLIEIVRVLLASGLIHCRECESQDWEKLSVRGRKCQKCKTKRSVTAGTFFEHMRAYHAWLAAIWFAERGIKVSSSIFHKLLNIAYSSARLIQTRVMMALQAPMQDDPDIVKVSTAAFIQLFRRRSFETEARQSPKSEEEAFSSTGSSASASESQATDTELPESLTKQLPDDQKAVLYALREAPLRPDQLAGNTNLPITEINACLSMLELDGLCQRLPGNQFIFAGKAAKCARMHGLTAIDQATSQSVDAASQFILSTNKGVSRKYLYIYLTAHWWHVAAKRQTRHSETVLQACLKLGKKTYLDIFNSVTPPVVAVSRACIAA